MILIFGGTTEGKIAAKLLDSLAQEYIYSTKSKVASDLLGEKIDGALSESEMIALCQQKNVNLIINASHPFAENLHQTIYRVKSLLGIPTVRFERSFPKIEEDSFVKLFPDYPSLVKELLKVDQNTPILALTGVNTISKLKEVWSNHPLYFRILNTEESIRKAKEQKIDSKFIFPESPYINKENLRQLVDQTAAKILLTKESGESGFFNEKLEFAKESGVMFWIVQRPSLPPFEYYVDSEKELLKAYYRIRKDQPKESNELLSGLTTGTCATAAAGAAFKALLKGSFDAQFVFRLPDETSVSFNVYDTQVADDTASCVVIKDAGDDPDVTHATEIGCTVQLISENKIIFHKGKGVGLVTMPGLQVAVGEPAINPVPRKMIMESIHLLMNEFNYSGGVIVTPFVPEGETLAKKTFNPRIGVVGGISILGTTGRVFPYSNKAFLESILQHILVAKHQNSTTIICTSGKRSENIIKPLFPDLTELSFIHYGNLIGDTLSLCDKQGFKEIILGTMLAKSLKLAEGHFNTHSQEVTFNAMFAAQIASETGYSEEIIEQIKKLQLANAICEIIPFQDSEPYYIRICQLCLSNCAKLLDENTEFRFILIQDTQFISLKQRPVH